MPCRAPHVIFVSFMRHFHMAKPHDGFFLHLINLFFSRSLRLLFGLIKSSLDSNQRKGTLKTRAPQMHIYYGPARVDDWNEHNEGQIILFWIELSSDHFYYLSTSTMLALHVCNVLRNSWTWTIQSQINKNETHWAHKEHQIHMGWWNVLCNFCIK